jgi:hypothetical protein
LPNSACFGAEHLTADQLQELFQNLGVEVRFFLERLQADLVSFAREHGMKSLNLVEFLRNDTMFVSKNKQNDAMIKKLCEAERPSDVDVEQNALNAFDASSERHFIEDCKHSWKVFHKLPWSQAQAKVDANVVFAPEQSGNAIVPSETTQRLTDSQLVFSRFTVTTGGVFGTGPKMEKLRL